MWTSQGSKWKSSYQFRFPRCVICRASHWTKIIWDWSQFEISGFGFANVLIACTVSRNPGDIYTIAKCWFYLSNKKNTDDFKDLASYLIRSIFSSSENYRYYQDERCRIINSVYCINFVLFLFSRFEGIEDS